MKKIIKKTLLLILVVATILSCTTVALGVSQAIGLGTVNSSDVIAHASKDVNSKTIMILARTSCVNVTEFSDGWYKVNYAGASGYVQQQFLDYCAAPCTFNTTGAASEGSVNVRSSRSTDASKLGSVSSGITTVGLEDGWFTIYYGGKSAYVRSDYFFLTGTNVDLTPKEITEENNEETTENKEETEVKEEPKKEEPKKEEPKPVETKVEEPEVVEEPLTGKLIKSHVQLRAGATSISSTVAQLQRGTVLEIIDEKDYNGWTMVSVDGQEGYVPTEYILKKAAPIEEEKEDETSKDDKTENKDSKDTKKTNTVQANSTSSTSVKAVGIVKDGEVRVYEHTDTESLVVTTLKQNNVVAVLGTESTWSHVKYNGKEGYIATSSIDTKSGNTELSTYGYIKADELNIRQSATTSAKKVGTVTKGKYVEVNGFENGWYKITYKSNIGFVSADYVNLTDTKLEAEPEKTETKEKETPEAAQIIGSGTGADIAAYAQQYVGISYVYGGASPSGFDCSGFTMYVYANYSYALPHGATGQLNYGTEISRDSLTAGDLVFFQDFNLSSSTASHVGIYIGNNQFIHASSSTGRCVKISGLDENYYNSHYLTARRLVS